MLTVRLPPDARARIRALAAVTGMSLQEVVIEAFACYYRSVPRALRQQAEQICVARRRYHV
jgi:hypothetical protein